MNSGKSELPTWKPSKEWLKKVRDGMREITGRKDSE